MQSVDTVQASSDVAPRPPLRARARPFHMVAVPLALAAAAALLAPFTTNPNPTAAAFASLAVISYLLWRPGSPPALLFVCSMQWLQGALKVLHADLLGVELWTLSEARSVEDATYYTLGWVTAIAVGAWLAVRRLDRLNVPGVLDTPVHMVRLLMVYGIWSLSLGVTTALPVGALRQVMEALAGLRWSVVFVIFVSGWLDGRYRLVALAVLLVETGLGFVSFFSEFRVPLYLFAIALLTVGKRLTLRQLLGFTLVAGTALYLGILWSAIKMDYRDRLSGGRGHQTQQVVLTFEESVDQLIELIGTVDGEVFEDGAEALVERIAYVDYFAYVLDYVPALQEHEDGKLWFGAVQHVLMPRMFFPDKKPLESDTAVTERYTGLVLGAGSGTSISIGVPAETYVDVGVPGMFVVGFFLGFLYGWGFRFLIVRGRGAPLSWGLAVALFLNLTSVGSAAPKVLGAYLSLFLIAVVLWQFIGVTASRFVSGANAR